MTKISFLRFEFLFLCWLAEITVQTWFLGTFKLIVLLSKPSSCGF